MLQSNWKVLSYTFIRLESQVGNMLDQDWFNPDLNYSTIRYIRPFKGIQGGVLGRKSFLFFTHLQPIHPTTSGCRRPIKLFLGLRLNPWKMGWPITGISMAQTNSSLVLFEMILFIWSKVCYRPTLMRGIVRERQSINYVPKIPRIRQTCNHYFPVIIYR